MMGESDRCTKSWGVSAWSECWMGDRVSSLPLTPTSRDLGLEISGVMGISHELMSGQKKVILVFCVSGWLMMEQDTDGEHGSKSITWWLKSYNLPPGEVRTQHGCSDLNRAIHTRHMGATRIYDQLVESHFKGFTYFFIPLYVCSSALREQTSYEV